MFFILSFCGYLLFLTSCSQPYAIVKNEAAKNDPAGTQDSSDNAENTPQKGAEAQNRGVVARSSSMTESFVSTPSHRAIDILFVIDNSGSMAEEQKNLARSFDAFIQDMKKVDLDFQIGVMSTDATRPLDGAEEVLPLGLSPWSHSAYQSLENLGSGSLLAPRGNDKVLSRRSSHLVSQFKNNVNLGTEGSGREMAIQSLIYGLSPELSLPGAWNAPLFREDTLLSIIIVSDEDETLSLEENDKYLSQDPFAQEQRFKEFDNVAMALKKNKRGLIRVDSIVSDPEQPCSTSIQSASAYAELSKAYGGEVFSICKDFSGILEKLGGNISTQAVGSFALEKKPQSISSVKLNGKTLDKDVTYTLNTSNNTVTLVGSAFDVLNQKEAKLEVIYSTIE